MVQQIHYPKLKRNPSSGVMYGSYSIAHTNTGEQKEIKRTGLQPYGHHCSKYIKEKKNFLYFYWQRLIRKTE